MRRFRHYTGIKSHWVFAVGLGVFWVLFSLWPYLESFADSGNDEVTIRFVERELLFLESGEESGVFVSWWTGQGEQVETAEELGDLLDATWSTERTRELVDQLRMLQEVEGAVVEDLFSEKEQEVVLSRSLAFGIVYPLAALGAIFALWFGRKGWLERGRVWRVTGVWSVPLVYTVFFLAVIFVDWWVYPRAAGLCYLLGGEKWGGLLGRACPKTASF